jgi:hypothetical protein
VSSESIELHSVIENMSSDVEQAVMPAEDSPGPSREFSRRWMIGAVIVTVAALTAMAVIGANHVVHQRHISQDEAKTNTAWDWVELLFSIRDNAETNAKMEQLKSRTVDPLRSDFEDQMAPFYDDYAQLKQPTPLHVTSAAFLTAGPAADEAAAAVPNATRVLITASVRQARGGRGNSFWVDVVDNDGNYAVAAIGVARS